MAGMERARGKSGWNEFKDIWGDPDGKGPCKSS